MLDDLTVETGHWGNVPRGTQTSIDTGNLTDNGSVAFALASGIKQQNQRHVKIQHIENVKLINAEKDVRETGISKMPENSTKPLKVTFSQGLPMGTKATFRHEGELWIAYPADKNQAIFSLVDRLVGIHAGIGKEMVRWINARPGDTELVTKVLEKVSRASALHDELCHEKTEAFTA